MSVVKSVLLFPFKLIGWLFQAFGFLIALVVVIYGAIFGYRSYQFWFAPTDTELGHNTTNFELARALYETRNTDPDCDITFGISANLLHGFIQVPSMVQFGLKNKTLPVYEIPLLAAEWPWYIAASSMWGFAESGVNPNAAKTLGGNSQCAWPKELVKLEMNTPEYSKEYLARIGVKSKGPNFQSLEEILSGN